MLNIILNWTIRLFLSNPLFLEGHVRFTMGFFTVFLIINTGVHNPWAGTVYVHVHIQCTLYTSLFS